MILWRHDPRVAAGMSRYGYFRLVRSPHLSGDEPVFINLVDALPAQAGMSASSRKGALKIILQGSLLFLPTLPLHCTD